MSVWKELLETARYAPSPHNVQPWRLRILSDETAELLIEKRRTLPKDPTDLEEIINADLNLARKINSFQISSYEDEAINRRLKICLETVKHLLHPLALTE